MGRQCIKVWFYFSLKAQNVLRGVVAPCCGVDNKVPQLHSLNLRLVPVAFAVEMSIYHIRS